MARPLADILNDILENMDRVAGYTAGKTEDDLVREPMLNDAIERCLERVSEASNGEPFVVHGPLGGALAALVRALGSAGGDAEDAALMVGRHRRERPFAGNGASRWRGMV